MKRLLVFILLVVAVVTPLFAEGPVKPLQLSGEPIHIKSDSLFTDNQQRKAVFTGSVTARQGDLVIYATELVFYYAEEGGEVDRVEGAGDVRISQGGRLATADHALYLNHDGKIILTGNPKVRQGKDFVSGDTIIYSVADGHSEVDGGSETQVEAVIHPTTVRKHDSGKTNQAPVNPGAEKDL
ncbi:MAG TPA: lipopolysaccharide transport periplasmic protein LptA [Geobacterales bacterium]|nr:lipopolysaccharide transport periplasmic protein LptA [Geobacterales bacterium]